MTSVKGVGDLQVAKIDTINELKIWLEGRFDLLTQAQKVNAEELRTIRQKVHDLSGDVQILLSLNIPAKFEAFTANIKEHDKQIEQLVQDGIARKSSLATARVLFLTLGGMLGTLATLVIQFWSMAHH